MCLFFNFTFADCRQTPCITNINYDLLGCFRSQKGPSRGLLRDCENRLWNRWIVYSTSADPRRVQDQLDGIRPGFGATINIINGGVECNTRDGRESRQARTRAEYYKQFAWYLYVDYEQEDLGCANQKQFSAGNWSVADTTYQRNRLYTLLWPMTFTFYLFDVFKCMVNDVAALRSGVLFFTYHCTPCWCQAVRARCPSTGTRTGPAPTPASSSTTRPPTAPSSVASTWTASRRTLGSPSDRGSLLLRSLDSCHSYFIIILSLCR